MSAKERNAKMSAERAFLSELLDTSLRGDAAKVRRLVEDYSSSHPGVSCGEVLSQFKDGNKRTALHFACRSDFRPDEDDPGKDGVLDVLLSDAASWLGGEDVVNALLRAKDVEGLTCLMESARHADRRAAIARVAALLRVGGGGLALARSKAGATALHYAAGVGADRDTIRSLWEVGKVALRTNSRQGGAPLHWAAGTSPKEDRRARFAETLVALIDDCGADLDAPNEQGMPALVLAAAANNDDAAATLVERGADATKILPGDVTVYHMAADLDLVRTLEALMTRSKEKERDDDDGVEPLHLRKNDNGETPLDLAAAGGHVRCVQLLLPEGRNTREDAETYVAQHQQRNNGGDGDDAPTTTTTTDATKESDDATAAAVDDEKLLFDGAKARAEAAAQEIRKRPAAAPDDVARAAELKSEGNVFFSRANYAAATAKYDAAVASNPSEAALYSNRAACRHAEGDHRRALEDAALARALRSDWSKPLFRMSQALLALEEYEEAATAAWEGLRMDQNNDELKDLLRRCVRTGNKAHHRKGNDDDKKEGEER